MPSRGGRQGAFLSPDQLTVSYGDARARIARGTGADWFGPLDPMPPVAPQEVASRQWDFPAGFNLVAAPRTYEPITFEKLRGLAETYDLLRLIIETRKDQVARMTWSIRPRKESAANANDPAAQKILAFFKRPDGVHGFSDWLRMLLEDLFVIDAPALYIQRDRIGRLLALLPLDGATIKPIIDDWGRTPQPYMEDGALVYPAAYQQALKGLPAIDYSVRDLIYRPRNVRAHSAYGFSPVEQIITSVGIALRRQIFALEYYTSGNIPDSLIGVPETWTPDQIANYQNYWDAYIEGDLGARRKAKFVPGGVAKTFIQTKEPELKSDFDEWLARICCFAFSVSPQALVKQMNRASADTQKELAEEEGLWPVLNWVKSLIDDVIEREFNAPELEFVWDQDAQVDVAQQAEILSTYVKAGVLTINEARQQLGQAPLADPAANRAMTLTATGYQPIGAGAGAAQGGVARALKYSVDQPRVSAGHSDGGQWTSGDAHASTTNTTRAVADHSSNPTRADTAQPVGIRSASIAAAPAVDFFTEDIAARAIAIAAETAVGVAAGLAILALGLLVLPARTGAGAVAGAVPGQPGVSYTWTPDEGVLVLSHEVDGQSAPFQVAQLRAEGIYYDAAGNPVARFVDGQLVVDPNAIQMDRAPEASADDTVSRAVGDTRAKPPAGCIRIDETDWSGDHGDIKWVTGSGGDDDVCVDPRTGELWAQNPDGTWTHEGWADDYTASGKAKGRWGKDRDRRRNQ